MPSTRAKDACDLLDADHRAVKKMFKEFEELTQSRARSAGQKKMDLARLGGGPTCAPCAASWCASRPSRNRRRCGPGIRGSTAE